MCEVIRADKISRNSFHSSTLTAASQSKSRNVTKGTIICQTCFVKDGDLVLGTVDSQQQILLASGAPEIDRHWRSDFIHTFSYHLERKICFLFLHTGLNLPKYGEIRLI
jgi:hypothetical protein